MSNGQNTQNVSLALGLLSSLLTNAAALSDQIKTAQASGVDLTDDQMTAIFAGYDAASTQLGQDIANARLAASTAAGV